MKLIIKSLLVLLIVSGASIAQDKKAVAIYMTGKNQNSEHSQLVEFALSEVLSESRHFTTTERTSDFMAAIDKEHIYQRSERKAVDETQIAELGKASGASYVCVSELIEYSSREVMLTARLIEVEKAVIAASTYRVAVRPDGDRAVKSLAKRLAETLIDDYEKRGGSAPKERAAIYLAGMDEVGAGEILQPLLINAVSRANKYAVSERTGAFLESLSKEVGYQYTGAVNDDQLAAMGRQAGVKYVIAVKPMGSILDVRLIDVVRAEVVDQKEDPINTGSAKAIEKSAANLIAKFLDVKVTDIFTELQEDIAEEKREEKRAEKERIKRGNRLRAGVGYSIGAAGKDMFSGVEAGLVIPFTRYTAIVPETFVFYNVNFWGASGLALFHVTTGHANPTRFFVEGGAGADWVQSLEDGFSFQNFGIVAGGGIVLYDILYFDVIRATVGDKYTSYRSGARFMF